MGPVRLHEPYLRCLNPAWVSFTHVWGLVIPHALLFGPNSVGGGCQSRHDQDFGQIRNWHETYIFACNRHDTSVIMMSLSIVNSLPPSLLRIKQALKCWWGAPTGHDMGIFTVAVGVAPGIGTVSTAAAVPGCTITAVQLYSCSS